MQTVHYRAVVFDLDGTAVDSRYNIDALQLTCQEMLGRSATDEELKLTYGMTAANAMRYLGVADDQIELFVQRWEQNIMALCQNASLYEGIYPVMCKLHQAGMLVGINTSRRSNELGDLHAYIREPFLDLCSLIVTCDKVQHRSLHPIRCCTTASRPVFLPRRSCLWGTANLTPDVQRLPAAILL